MKRMYLALAALLPLAGCATTPATPMEAHLNRYAGAEAVAMNCPAYGGYGSVAQMRADAQANLAKARALGATEADVAQARQRVNGNLMGATVLVGPIEACNAFVNRLAWVGADTPVIPPKKATGKQIKKP